MRVNIPYLKSTVQLYAVGDLDAIRQAIRYTFSSSGMKTNEKGHQTVHYPGGWFGRAGSAFLRFNGPGYHEADVFFIEYSVTSNPAVTLLETYVSLQTSVFKKHKLKKQGLIDAFMKNLIRECNQHEISLVRKENWTELVTSEPALRCSPCWKS